MNSFDLYKFLMKLNIRLFWNHSELILGIAFFTGINYWTFSIHIFAIHFQFSYCDQFEPVVSDPIKPENLEQDITGQNQIFTDAIEMYNTKENSQDGRDLLMQNFHIIRLYQLETEKWEKV